MRARRPDPALRGPVPARRVAAAPLIAAAALAASLVGSLVALAPAASAQIEKKLPYWASIAQPVARMRKGPSPDLPVTWEYRREGLPVKVIGRYETWRKVVDPDGTIGWMAARLLSAERTGYVTGRIRALRTAPRSDAPVAYRAEPGVVGTLDDCEDGWCRLSVGRRSGYIRSNEIWGGSAP